MNVGCLHYELVDDVAANRESLFGGLETVLADADLAVGPETATIYVAEPANTGRRYRRNAEPLDGPTVSAAQEIVEREGGVAVFGLPERDGQQRYNSSVVLEAGREPRVSRQPLYPEWDETHGWVTDYGPLETPAFDTGVGTIQPVICADISHRAPYIGSKNHSGGIDLVTLSANWHELEAEYRRDDYEPLLDRWAAHAERIGAPLAVSNSYRGIDQEWPSAIIADGAIQDTTTTPGEIITSSW